MQSYQYQYGDKPLEGYTIQRAVGRGGFGEVYYAISDAGREVALKEVQVWEQIELRGIQQCMNLKNPHLVTIFDVKYSDKGRPFVIMEYVSGPSLADIIAESPNGLGSAKTAFFIKEICKGLGYLHDCGIVHRDLKPSNIFYDNGVVKIGDYGLSKSINTSRYSNQTITVGTVHYMAPEVGAGKYDRSIDIYAMGVMCYEMLTGKVPYAGESPAEVLLKHLNSQPDLTGIDPAFTRVIAKAMSRNPEDRYHTVSQIVEDLFGSETVKQSMSQFNPLDLSMYAARTAQKIQTPQVNEYAAARQEDFRGQVKNAAGKIVETSDQLNDDEYKRLAAMDTLSRKQRIILALLLSGIISFAVGLFTGHSDEAITGIGITTMLMIAGGGGGILLARKKLLNGMEPNIIRNWATAAFGILAAGVLSFALWQGGPDEFGNHTRGTFLSMIVLGFADFWKITDFCRKKRVDIIPAFAMGVPAIIISLIFNGQPLVSFAVICGICLFVQILWPYLGPEGQKPQVAANVPAKPAYPAMSQPTRAVKERPAAQAVSYSVPVNPAQVSPFKRVWALIFCTGICIGFAGLQRFYVGKIGTGILWFFTGGLLGIGQLIDFIMILAGNFRDKQGRRLLLWESETPSYMAYDAGKRPNETKPGSPSPAAAAAPASQPQQTPPSPQPKQPTTVIIKDSNAGISFFSGILAFIGYILLSLGMLILFLGALHIPQVVLKIPDLGIDADMKAFWGTPNWSSFCEQLFVFIGYCILFVSLVMIIFARRRHGAAHILRAVIAFGFLVLAVVVCNEVISYSWQNIEEPPAVQEIVPNPPGYWSQNVPESPIQDIILNPPGYPSQQPVGARIEQLGNAIFKKDMIFAVFFLIAAIVLLAWPPKRRPPQIVTLNPDQQTITL